MRTSNVIVQDWDLSCGAAALATLMRYDLGIEVTERDVAIGMMRRKEYVEQPLLVRIREGFSLLDMQRFAARHGLIGEGFGELAFEDLIRRAPVIVPVNRHGYNHFVIFRGAMGDRVLLADPSFGTRTLRRDQFERMWKETPGLGRVGFTVRRPDGRGGGLVPQAHEFLTLR